MPDGAKEAMTALHRVMELPKDQRRDYLEMLGFMATTYMRLLGGDDYARGWLTEALVDLDKPPTFTLRRPQ